MTTLLILPPDRRRARRLAAAARTRLGRLARAARRARGGRRLDPAARPLRLRPGRAAVLAAADLVQRPQRLVPRRRLRLLGLADRADRRRDGRRDRLRVLGGTRAVARLHGADAVPHRRDRRRLRRAGPPPLLRLLRGDADPALRPGRRLGRAGTDRRDAQVRASTRWRARC